MAEPAFKIGGIVEPPYFVGRDGDVASLQESLTDLS